MPNHQCAELFIAGASARSAARSAASLGIRVRTADLFADLDLPLEAERYKVDNFPHGLISIAKNMAPAEWMYTGGLENHAPLIRAISQHHRLLGCHADAVARVRDPRQVADELHSAGLRSPRPKRLEQLTGDQTWLRKPFAGCGGRDIHRVAPSQLQGGPDVRHSATSRDLSHKTTGDLRVPQHLPHPRPVPGSAVSNGPSTNTGAYYYQSLLAGLSLSANYVASEGTAVLLGVTYQLVGTPWSGARPFQYAGSIGPVALNPSQQLAWQRIGRCLARKFDLQGLFGIDAIVSKGEIWTVDVNPRFCASIEILERGYGWNGLAIHLDACRSGSLPPATSCKPRQLHGKAILFADRDIGIEARHVNSWFAMNQDQDSPLVADLPQPGTEIKPGQPVLTVFANGQQREEVQCRLQDRMARIRRMLAPD